MPNKDRDLFERLFERPFGSLRGDNGLSQPEEKMVCYVIHRFKQDATLEEVA